MTCLNFFAADRTKKFNNTSNLNMSMSQTMLGPSVNLNSSFNNSSPGQIHSSTWGPSSTGTNLLSTYAGSAGALNNTNNVLSNGWLGMYVCSAFTYIKALVLRIS